MGWVAWALLTPLVAACLLVGAWSLIVGAAYLAYLATRATVFDVFGVLSLVAGLLALTAIVGAGVAIRRRKPLHALGFSVLALPIPFVMQAPFCDMGSFCRAVYWASLPEAALKWQVRLRPVTDPNEARGIASAALSASGSNDSPWKTMQFGDYWIVSATDRDGWAGAHAVRVDTRTARTSLIPCPANQIRCGMERPTAPGVFRNERLGLAATFPASHPVCTARANDDVPRGFYSVAREPDIPCDIVDQSRRMGVEVARDKRNGCTAVEAPKLPWRPLSPESAKLFRRLPPSLGGLPSLACELHEGDYIQISVFAFGPGRVKGVAPSAPLFEGYILTTADHLAEDVHAFEAFLADVHIG